MCCVSFPQVFGRDKQGYQFERSSPTALSSQSPCKLINFVFLLLISIDKNFHHQLFSNICLWIIIWGRIQVDGSKVKSLHLVLVSIFKYKSEHPNSGRWCASHPKLRLKNANWKNLSPALNNPAPRKTCHWPITWYPEKDHHSRTCSHQSHIALLLVQKPSLYSQLFNLLGLFSA